MTDLISYAQNFEDVRLWRALASVHQGCYIDIGAQSPVVDSVSRVFYEHGWKGVHVDAMAVYADELRAARPGDIVIHAAVGAEKGTLAFFGIPETGLSTTQSDIAEKHREAGFTVQETVVPAITLDDVFDRVGGRDVHWLKIDVEGGERNVLLGWREAPTRPWIIVVESTVPLTEREAFEPWENLVLEKGYFLAHFDGLNRYYVSNLHKKLAQSFVIPPNLFDGFALSTTSSTPFCREFSSKIGEASLKLDEARTKQAEDARVVEKLSQQIEAVSEGLRLQRIESSKLNLLLTERNELARRQTQHMTELNLNLDVLQGALAAARLQIHEHAESAHHWWVTAESIRAELAQIHASKSWRLAQLFAHSARIFVPRRLRSSLRYRSKKLLIGVTLSLAAYPSIRAIGRRVLSIIPGFRERLRLAVVHSIASVQSDAGDSRDLSTTLVQRRGPDAGLLGLRASKILDDLNRAIGSNNGMKD